MIRAVRIGLGLVGAVLLFVGAVMLRDGEMAVAALPTLLGLLALGIALFEQTRYSAPPGDAASPPASVRRTDEVFVDPTTGLKTRVWVDPATGEREYRPDA